MSTTIAIARAALSGTVQLLTLCLCGAYLAGRKVLTQTSCAAFSQAIFNVFLPALLFVSILGTLSNVSITEYIIFFPSLWALVTLLVSSIVALTVIKLTGSCLEEGVRRVLFISLLLGNANNLPILLLDSLCDNFHVFKEDATCKARGVGYVAMFLAAWNTFMWTAVLSYVVNAPEESPLELPPPSISASLSELTGGSSSSNASSSEKTRLLPKSSTLQKVCSPPFIAILAAMVMSQISYVSNLFLEGALVPIHQALTLLGHIVVPASSLIVGARLYAFHTEKSARPSKPLSALLIISIILTRFALMPIVGTFLFKLFRVKVWIQDPVLQIYLLIPYFMPTASNSVVMVQMAMMKLKNGGRAMEQALLTLIFWQYVVAPICLTFNMYLGLLQVFGPP